MLLFAKTCVILAQSKPTIMMLKNSLLTIFLFVFMLSGVSSQEGIQIDRDKKIVILGSSVASGWVSSYKEKYDMQNGYAYRLGRQLQAQGWKVVNISIPGFDTKSTIERFDAEVLPLNPGYVLIGLSMSNEGLETQNPDTVFKSYREGIKKLIQLCKVNNIQAVVGLCYSNDNYTEEQYEYLKRMNRLISSWDVPSINFLGVLDDGHGHFPEGYTFDPNHPNDRGHEEMFYAFVPDMFDALEAGKDLPQADMLNKKMIALNTPSPAGEISYIPSDVMHSFTVSFYFKSNHAGSLLSIQESETTNILSIGENGILQYMGNQYETKSEIKINTKEAHNLTFTHQYLTKDTRVYIDGKMMFRLKEQLEPVMFTIGEKDKKTDLGQLLIYRAALNQEEINMLRDGKLYGSGLEVASLLTEADFKAKSNKLTNYALSLGNAFTSDENLIQETAFLIGRIEEAQYEREHELKVEHRKAIDIDPAELDQFVGTYEIATDDNMLVVKEDDKLYLDDHGRKAEILPEGDGHFFIHYPGDILVIFQKDESGMVSGLIFSMNGREMEAKKVQEEDF